MAVCEGERRELCRDLDGDCIGGSLHDPCECADGYFPWQVGAHNTSGLFYPHIVHFTCCPGPSQNECGDSLTHTSAFPVFAIALLGILLSTFLMRFRIPPLWQLLSRRRRLLWAQVDGTSLHREVPMGRWCVTKRDLQDFRVLVQQAVAKGDIQPTALDPFDPTDFTIGPNMHTVTEQYIKPVTDACGKASWALMQHPHGLQCDLFITHCWVEGVYEFLDKVLASWPLMAKAAYICFLSNPQNLDIGELIASPEESPFAKALHVAHHILVVPNRSASIYSRIWCVYEAFLAYAWGKQIYTAWSFPQNLWLRVLRVGAVYVASASLTVLAMPWVEHELYSYASLLLTLISMKNLWNCFYSRPNSLVLRVAIVFAAISCPGHLAVTFFGERGDKEQHNGIGLIVCWFAICAMEFDRLMLADAHQQSKQLQKGFKGLSGARSSREEDKDRILAALSESGHEKDVEEVVEVLMRMNVTTPELREAAARSGPLGDASKFSCSLVLGSCIFWLGSPVLLLMYDVEHAEGLRSPLFWIVAVECVAAFLGFLLLPNERKPFAARCQQLWAPMLVVHLLDRFWTWHYYAVSAVVGFLVLSMGFVGPGRVAQIPCLGPAVVRVLFGRPPWRRSLQIARSGSLGSTRTSPETDALHETPVQSIRPSA
ncbi:unnamed protein product [Effrenium voratum]|nr:unnamed protein product [Effrenium voratum]